MRAAPPLTLAIFVTLSATAAAQQAPGKKPPVVVPAPAAPAKPVAPPAQPAPLPAQPAPAQAAPPAAVPAAPAQPVPTAPAQPVPTAPAASAAPAPATTGAATPLPAPAAAGSAPPPVEFKANPATTPNPVAPATPGTKGEPSVPVSPDAEAVPPPPPPQHLAPNNAIVLGARLGWFFPTGGLWSKGVTRGDGMVDQATVDWAGFASSGPMFELNGGVRLGRSYTLFGLWEHSFLGAGALDDDASLGTPSAGSTDLYGGGLRFSTNPDKLGLLLEIGLGYRVFSTSWSSGTKINFEGESISARLGIGLNYRFSESLELSPMITLGSGSFGNATITYASGETRTTLSRGGIDVPAQHIPISFQIGGHFDIPILEKKE